MNTNLNLAELFHHATDLTKLSAGETLFREGDQGQFMYILMTGSVEISVHGRVVEIAEAGATLGEMAMISDEPRSATVMAQSDCTLLPLERERFNFLIQQTPNFALKVMRIIATRLRRTDAIL